MNVDLTNEEHIALFRLVTHALGLWCRDESLRLAQAPCLREAGTIDLLWTAQVWATVPLLPAKIAAFLDQTSMGRLGNPIAMIPETLLVRPGVGALGLHRVPLHQGEIAQDDRWGNSGVVR